MPPAELLLFLVFFFFCKNCVFLVLFFFFSRKTERKKPRGWLKSNKKSFHLVFSVSLCCITDVSRSLIFREPTAATRPCFPCRAGSGGGSDSPRRRFRADVTLWWSLSISPPVAEEAKRD